MIFYCPSCRKEVELVATGTITTKSGRVAYKATCPVCGLDLTEFAAVPPPPQITPTPPPEPEAVKAQVVEPVPDQLPIPVASADETIKAYIGSLEETPDPPTPTPTTPASVDVSVQSALNQAVKTVTETPLAETEPKTVTPTDVEEFPIDSSAQT